MQIEFSIYIMENSSNLSITDCYYSLTIKTVPIAFNWSCRTDIKRVLPVINLVLSITLSGVNITNVFNQRDIPIA